MATPVGSSYSSFVAPLSPEAEAIQNRINQMVFFGECVLIASGFAAVGGVACLAGVVFFQASLAVPAIGLLVASAALGVIGQMLVDDSKTQLANFTSLLPPPFKLGQPIGLVNEGQTCFINSIFQAMMNDQELLQALVDSFKREIAKYEDLARFAGGTEEASELLIEEFRTWKLPVKEYPTLGAKEKVAVDAKELKQDGLIAQAVARKDELKHKIAALRAFCKAVEAYRLAERDHIRTVPQFEERGALGWLTAHRHLLEPLRHIMSVYSPYKQEDANEFFQQLLNWVDGSKYPGLFFNKGVEIEWKRYEPTSEDDRSIRERQFGAKRRDHDENPTRPDKQLNVLPANATTQKIDGYACVLTIDHPLSEGALGQTLIDDTLTMKAHPEQADPYCFYDGWMVQKAARTVIEGNPGRVIIHLKRFEYVDDTCRKIDCTVQMPDEVMVNGKAYTLQSIVEHLGSYGYGHYTACVKKPDGRWWYASDSYVDLASPAQLKSAHEKGYLYFYSLKKTD